MDGCMGSDICVPTHKYHDWIIDLKPATLASRGTKEIYKRFKSIGSMCISLFHVVVLHSPKAANGYWNTLEPDIPLATQHLETRAMFPACLNS